jgi:hypothetical protein
MLGLEGPEVGDNREACGENNAEPSGTMHYNSEPGETSQTFAITS